MKDTIIIHSPDPEIGYGAFDQQEVSFQGLLAGLQEIGGFFIPQSPVTFWDYRASKLLLPILER